MTTACDHEHPTRPPAPLAEPEVVARGASILRAMGDPERLRLLERLAVGGEHCVSELAVLSDAEMSTVSQRLRQLRAARLVSRRRDGKHVYYAIADEHVADLVRSALEHAAEERGEAR
ncbi:MAG TPA: metalloregulator ArsR/SmtB family transcription factor [Sandaracinaceae bacterium LLY-WYZ-13_1]|nr:metalloregulator ArsR/SmtB family transcription factor [Sandaracinaceae bacterium LLY-WYZ-13_1]